MMNYKGYQIKSYKWYYGIYIDENMVATADTVQDAKETIDELEESN